MLKGATGAGGKWITLRVWPAYAPSAQNVLIPKCMNIDMPPTTGSEPPIHCSCRAVGTGKVVFAAGLVASQPLTCPGHCFGDRMFPVKCQQSSCWEGFTVPSHPSLDASCQVQPTHELFARQLQCEAIDRAETSASQNSRECWRVRVHLLSRATK